jgi:hypothetical protein
MDSVGVQRGAQHTITDMFVNNEVVFDISADELGKVASLVTATMKPSLYEQKLVDYGCSHNELDGHIADEIIDQCCRVVLDY